MKLFIRIIALILVVPGSYYFVYWLPCSLLPYEPRWIANVISLTCAIAAGWFVWVKIASANSSAISSTLLGAILVGGTGFIGGFIGPMIFTPDSNQGPFLGILITGPAGIVIGGITGFIYWTAKDRKKGHIKSPLDRTEASPVSDHIVGLKKDTMYSMIKISSKFTFFHKKLFPLLWFGFLASFIFDALKDRIYEKAPIVLLVPCLMVVAGIIIMNKLVWNLADEVYDCGEFLLIKKSGHEERVQLSNIMNISASTNMNPQRITIKLVQPGMLGAEIAFSPATPFTINPFSKNKISEDLIVRVDQARTRRQFQSDSDGVNSNISVQNIQKIELRNEFALEKNTASLAALFIIASMLIYALVDTVFINLYEIVGYPDNKSLLIVLSAMPICFLGYIIHSYLIRSSVPERETIILTILCVISLAIAAHPILQRIDKITASKPMQTYNYRMIKQGVFEPTEIGLPNLNLRTQCEYWQQYKENTSLQFSLQYGGLGMWQLDGEALDKDIYVYLKKLHPSNFIGNFRIK